MNDKPQILIVDDDYRLRTLITAYLHQEGFEVKAATNSEEAFWAIRREKFSMIILDINLPIMDGLTICKRLRHSGVTTPIIMLTARGEESDRVHGLEIGADDYLTKPFNPRELVARIRAVLRRQSIASFSPLEARLFSYCFRDFELDIQRRVLLKNGENLHLTSGEFELLQLFISEAGKPLSREQLVSRIASREHQIDQRAIDMLVSRLRKRLDAAGSKDSLIRTLRGIGYMLVADVVAKKLA